MGYTIAMYETLTHFLTTFSVQRPFLWALLVMVVIAFAGLLLYGFWELALRGAGWLLGGSRSGDAGAGAGHASGRRGR